MLTPPTQVRTIDPFENERFSTAVNRFTRIYTGGEDWLLYPNESFQLSDSTGINLIGISSGFAIKDDVLIHVSDSFDLDFTDDDYYLDEIPGMISNGWYYILLYYNFTRQYPPPSAYYRILRNTSLFTTYLTNYLFLGAAYVTNTSGGYLITEGNDFIITENEQYLTTEIGSTSGSSREIINYLEYDPTNPTVAKRRWLEINWVGT